MSTQQQILHLSTPVPSDNSFDYTSSQWSMSTKSNIVRGGSCSLIDESENATNRCFPILQIFQSLFQRKKSMRSVDSSQLLDDLKEHTDLIVEFFEGSLIHGLKLFAEKTHFPKLPKQASKKFELFQINGNLFLPSAQVWTATYLLFTLCSHSQHSNESVTESTVEEGQDSRKSKFLNSNSFRRSLISLYWEMQVTRKVARDFHTRFLKFANEINGSFKKLRSVFTSSLNKLPPPSNRFQMILMKDVDFKVKRNIEKILKYDKSSALFETKSTFTKEDFLFSISIDTSNSDGCIVTRNQDCSKLSLALQEELIMSLLKSTADSIENCRCVLETSAKRISSREIIKIGTNGSKDVTCYKAINSVTEIVTALLSRREYAKLDESEQNRLYTFLSVMHEKWSEYVGFSQWMILKFHELCDMITTCYLFTLQHTKMSIPEPEAIQKEVKIKSKFQKKDKSMEKQDKLKQYAIGVLIEECNAKGASSTNVSNTSNSQIDINFYQQSVISTKYHLAILESPLEVGTSWEKYTIRPRSIPDPEKVESEMILLDRDYMIEMKTPREYKCKPHWTETADSFQFQSFMNNNLTCE